MKHQKKKKMERVKKKSVGGGEEYNEFFLSWVFKNMFKRYNKNGNTVMMWF